MKIYFGAQQWLLAYLACYNYDIRDEVQRLKVWM